MTELRANILVVSIKINENNSPIYKIVFIKFHKAQANYAVYKEYIENKLLQKG